MNSLYLKGKTLGFLQTMVFALYSQSGPGAIPKWLGRILVIIFGESSYAILILAQGLNSDDFVATCLIGYIGLLAGYQATYNIYTYEEAGQEVKAHASGTSVNGGEMSGSSKQRAVAMA